MAIKIERELGKSSPDSDAFLEGLQELCDKHNVFLTGPLAPVLGRERGMISAVHDSGAFDFLEVSTTRMDRVGMNAR